MFEVEGVTYEFHHLGIPTQSERPSVTAARLGRTTCREALRFKKKLFAVEQARSDVARWRWRWRSWQASLDPRRLVFIDETWIKTNMARLRGWGVKGARLRGVAPQGHWRTMTFLGALRRDQLTAPCVFDSPINGECFRAYVEQQLIPVLKPGDIVVMDNLGSRKSAALRRLIRAAGARLWYLPPYSPDLNPIEQAFAKIKHLASRPILLDRATRC